VEFNLKLYAYLKKKKSENCIFVANDLDTILPNYFLSKKFNIPLIYDSHEIFTEMPSLNNKWTKKIWQLVEKITVPNIKYMMCANDSYAEWYEKKYAINKPVVVRNLPKRITNVKEENEDSSTKIILYQGAINPSRGLDKVIPAMKLIDNAALWIVGTGPKLEEYQGLSESLKLTEKIKFLGKLSPEKLREITPKASVGISIEENNGWSYYYSLPNKISDYIQSGVPVVCSNFPEMKKIINRFAVGEFIENHSEIELSNKINKVLALGKNYYKPALENASKELCWENEQPNLLALYNQVVQETFN
jgi:glycosyltransferase involved in cell wall biosynthesis